MGKNHGHRITDSRKPGVKSLRVPRIPNDQCRVNKYRPTHSMQNWVSTIVQSNRRWLLKEKMSWAEEPWELNQGILDNWGSSSIRRNVTVMLIWNSIQKSERICAIPNVKGNMFLHIKHWFTSKMSSLALYINWSFLRQILNNLEPQQATIVCFGKNMVSM